MQQKVYKCFFCKQEILLEEPIKHNISENKTSIRRFHKKCLDEYISKKEFTKQELKDWDDLYKYVKKEILKYDDCQNLTPHTVLRLQGIRNGKYKPNKKSKVFFSEEGYPYKVILMTFKVKKIDILSAIKDKSKFKTEQHKIDYIIAIITNSINDVYIRMKEREESNNKIKNLDMTQFNNTTEYECTNKTQIKENKVANKLKDLF